MAFIQYRRQPVLRSPVVVAAFAGWNDAADSATTAVKFLIDKWKPAKLAEIDSEEFLVFTETRPTTRLVNGERVLVWPTNQFFYHKMPDLDRDIILYLGVEPQLKWKKFVSGFLEVCEHYSVSEILLLGAFLADVPHTRAVPISSLSSHLKLEERLGGMDVNSSRYEGPTGILGVLHDTSQRANMPTASFWAAAPHYLAATPNIKVASAFLTYLNSFLSLNLDLKDIQAEAMRFEEHITALVARDPEASAYVQKLEQQITGQGDEDDEDDEDDNGDIIFNPDRAAGTGPLPSADVLIRGVEELLRKQRENNQTEPDDDEDNE